MIEVIKNAWIIGSFWDRCFILFSLGVIATCLAIVIRAIRSTPSKRMKFIEEARKDGRVAVAKMSCFTAHGRGRPEYLHAEYMYVVNGQRHFVTYEMAVQIEKDDDMENMNADMLVNSIQSALVLFYDKKDPTKVMNKFEVFVSHDAMHKMKTPKKNIWRDADKNWTEPIMLLY